MNGSEQTKRVYIVDVAVKDIKSRVYNLVYAYKQDGPQLRMRCSSIIYSLAQSDLKEHAGAFLADINCIADRFGFRATKYDLVAIANQGDVSIN